MHGRVLFVDDQPERFDWFAGEVERIAQSTPGLGLAGSDVLYASSGPEALDMLDRLGKAILVAVVDMDFSRLPPDKELLGPDVQREGLDIARRMRQLRPEMPIFIFTMNQSEVSSPLDPRVHVMPFDYVIRGDVVQVVLSLLSERQAREKPEARDEDIPPSLHRAPGLQRLRKLARSGMRILILGAPGTGKTTLALWLHAASGKRGRCELIECTQFPAGSDPSFLRSALFGQVKNVPPGAPARRGACVLASDGTLFLDEVAELPQEHQAMLLRAAKEGTIRALGGSEDLAVSFRLISATNRPVEDLRNDLFFRISEVRLELPPLIERPEDIRWFAEKELAKVNAFRDEEGEPRLWLDEEAVRTLEGYDWPGNAHEVSQAIRRAALNADGSVLWSHHLPESVQRKRFPSNAAVVPESPTSKEGCLEIQVGENLDLVVRRYLLACWASAGFDAPRAADLAGVGRATLWRALRRAGMATLARVELDGEPIAAAGDELGIGAEAATRLRQDAEVYLRGLARRGIDVAGKATELGLEPERIALLLERVANQLS